MQSAVRLWNGLVKLNSSSLRSRRGIVARIEIIFTGEDLTDTVAKLPAQNKGIDQGM